MNAISKKESMGCEYMTLALRYGYIELREGLALYSAAGLDALGMKNREGVKAAWPAGTFFFVDDTRKPGRIFECFDPLHVIDCMESRETGYGTALPVSYRTTGEKRYGIY